MKKLLLTAMAMACVSIASAQTFDLNSIQWSVRAGVNVAGFNESAYSNRTGYHVGVMGEMHLINRFYFQSGLGISTLGATHSTYFHDTETEFKLTYLRIPFMASYRIPLKRENRYFDIHAGFYASYGIGGKIDIGDETVKSFKSSEGGFNRFDAGFRFGIGWQLNRIYLGVASESGLVKAHKDIDVKNKAWVFTLGYSF